MSAGTNKAQQPHEIVERALELSRADGCVVIADEQSTANLRWAGNALTTNGVTRGRTLTVIATVDGKEGTASGVVSRAAVTKDELEPLVRAAEAAARGAAPAEDAQPLVADVARSPEFTEAPAETSSAVFADFAPALGEAFARARAGVASCTGSPTTSSSRRTWARRPDCGCGTTSRTERWSSTPSPRTGPARRGPGAPPGTSRTSTRRRSTPSWPYGWAGRSGGSSCPPGGTRRCCRRPRWPT